MAEYVTGVRTQGRDVHIDYNALANLPKFDTKLQTEGCIADAKAVGDALANKADITYVYDEIESVKNDTTNINVAVADVKKYVDESTSVLKVKEENEGNILKVVKVTNEDESESWEASWESASSALDATANDNGKILTVVNGTSVWDTYSNVLEASADHNGKILTVVNGEAKWETPANAFTPSIDNGGSEGDDGEDGGDAQKSAGQVLVNVDGAAKWESIANAIAATADAAGQFLSVDFITNDDNEVIKVASWRTVIDADKVAF